MVLTKTEKRASELFALGFTKKQIAGQMSVNISTVKGYLNRSKQKLNVVSDYAFIKKVTDEILKPDPSKSWGIGSYSTKGDGNADGYGYARPENPANFWPDLECCEPSEIANHRSALNLKNEVKIEA